MTSDTATDTPQRMSGGELAMRLVASIALTPIGAAVLMLTATLYGSAGGADEARAVAWWLEPFRQLRRTR